MSGNKSQYSDTLKKDLSTLYTDKRSAGLQTVSPDNPLRKNIEAYSQTTQSTVEPFTGPVRFDINFRDAVKEHHSTIMELVDRGIQVYNEHIAGGTYPRDVLDWLTNKEVVAFKEEAITEFSRIGKALAKKKRNLHASDALNFMFHRILQPMSAGIWVHIRFRKGQ